MNKSRLKTLLQWTGVILVLGAIIGTLMSLPNYMNITSMAPYTLFFMIFTSLFQMIESIAIGLLCIYAARHIGDPS